MLREFSVEATVGKPQVAYRETITKTVESVEYRHIKQSGGSGQFAVVKITPRAEPRQGLRVRRQDQRRQDPARVHPARPTRASSPRSIRACSPATRWSTSRPALVDGQYHDVDSSEMAFKIAGQMGFKKAAEMASPVLLEPIMGVEVVTPEEYMGDVIGDLVEPSRPDRGHGGPRQHPGQSGPRCRCRRCSATPPTCARAPRAGRRTRCSSTATSEVPERHRVRHRQARSRRVIARSIGTPFFDNPQIRNNFNDIGVELP